MPKRNSSEAVAKAILEALVSDVDARFQHPQSKGEVDFELFRGAERIGVMEVTMSTSQELRNNIGAIDGKKHGAPIIPRPEVSHAWIIHPMLGAPIQTIRTEIGAYLAEIEAEGLELFFIHDVMKSAAVRRIFEDLRVEFGMRFPSNEGIGSVSLAYPSDPEMSPVKPEPVLRAVRTEMEKPDNLRKLRDASDGTERHLFIVIDPYHYPPWKALNACEPPETGPDLADEVTHVWVAADTFTSAGWIVWYATRGSRWQRTWFHGRIELNDE